MNCNNSIVDTIKPLQTQNLDIFMDLLDNQQNFSDLTQLVDEWTAFYQLMTLDHLHSTIQQLEKKLEYKKPRLQLSLIN